MSSQTIARKFSELSAMARVVWAKSGEKHGHSLLAHLLDVAAVVEVMLEREPESTSEFFSKLFGVSEELFGPYLASLSGLHDFGKAIPGFQAKWDEGKLADQNCGFVFADISCRVTDHALATASLLRFGLQKLTGAGIPYVGHVVGAISAHHGYHYLATEINEGKPIGESKEWALARQEILEAYWYMFAVEARPSVNKLSLPAVNWLAGITSAADWIASNPEWFPLGERYDDLCKYYDHAKSLARYALDQIGWNAARSLLKENADTESLLARIVGREKISARPLQQIGDQLLGSVAGPALLLVEAPMGEGKTELAFLAHLRLQAANRHRGLFVALPTQATGNALFKRALKFVGNFADGDTDIQLIHGGASMNEDVRHLRGINHSRTEGLSASAWFSQRKRPLLSPYGVGTVDQALLSILNVKHHFVRLWGLGNRVVVLDEVHAYDTYTSGLIVVLLKWLKALNCSVVLMSATLPKARCRELMRAWGVDVDKLPELDYPRIILADSSGVRGETFPARPLSPIRVFGIGETLEELADNALQRLSGGGCGVVIVNTVDRAQKLYLALRDKLSEQTKLLLFHARFPADERGNREQDVMSLFGESCERPASALLIATQVVEQSLDIDFDFMLSDLAPVDLLLQRAGRLHRHQRVRPEQHADATLWVAGLLKSRLPELKETAWGYVYEPYILGRTWALLKTEDVLNLPEDIDRLVQAVYETDAILPDGLADDVRQFIEIEAYGEYLAKLQKERQQAKNAVIDPFDSPNSAYVGKRHGNEEGEGFEMEIRTRLGPESITLIPVEADGSEWRVYSNSQSFSPDQPIDDALARQLYNRQIKVSRKAVVEHFKAMQRPLAFTEHSLLRSFFPLPLLGGSYECENLKLTLDVELGLVFGESDKENKEIS